MLNAFAGWIVSDISIIPVHRNFLSHLFMRFCWMSQENVYHYKDIIMTYHYNVKLCAKVVLSMKAVESTLLNKVVPQWHKHVHEH